MKPAVRGQRSSASCASRRTAARSFRRPLRPRLHLLATGSIEYIEFGGSSGRRTFGSHIMAVPTLIFAGNYSSPSFSIRAQTSGLGKSRTAKENTTEETDVTSLSNSIKHVLEFRQDSLLRQDSLQKLHPKRVD